MKCSVSSLLLATGLAAWPGPTALAQVAVETFTATQTISVQIPGTLSGGDILFAGQMTFNTLDFTPGTVTFEGQPVDFDGTEADFLASTYDCSLAFLNMPGQAVNAVGVADIQGPGGNAAGNLQWVGINLGPGFSETSYDLTVGSQFQSLASDLSWSSAVVPELNGRNVSVQINHFILSVDAINGILDVDSPGAIFGVPAAEIPVVSGWGLVTLAFGLIGVAIWLIYRRRHGTLTLA